MSATARVHDLFEASIAVKKLSLDVLPGRVARAAKTMTDALENHGRVLACGNGGSAADAQHFAAELVNRFERERRALAAIALATDGSNLTSIANDHAFRRVFSRQVEALGRQGDVLLAISTSGNSENVVAAIETARDRGLTVVLLSGADGGAAARALGENDVEIRAPSAVTARVQEVHITAIHALCALIDDRFASLENQP